MNKLTDCYTLKNGVKIPCIGFGTWQTPDGETAVNAVKTAIECGYRHIDGAAVYANESSVGEGIKASGIARDEIFVTSKVWNDARGYDKTLAACDKSLKDFGLDYFDLYLIHWPANAINADNWDDINMDTWRAMIKLYEDGKARSIGVSNFLPHHLASLMNARVAPMVNQIECHPGFMQGDTIDYCVRNNILVEAWSPMGSGAMFSNDVVRRIAGKYSKSVAHICIRWNLQHGILPLPKSVTPSRIKDNTNVFDFEISPEDMSVLDSMPQCGYSGNNPDTFNVI
ncbi:MAG: aldo/keto reductase [Clostridia bacterium]|nr:aldo/keto reductase [Clostridia bacterium]